MPSATTPKRYPLLGPLDRLDKIIDEVRPDRVVVALAERRGRLPVRQLLDSQISCGVVVEDAVEAYERLTGKVAIEMLMPGSVVFSRAFRKSRLTLLGSRVVSVLAALIGLSLLAPLSMLIAIAIKLDSRGPVFFVHDRVGRCGRRFKLIKFRSMRPAERAADVVVDDGHRVTRVGRWLRKFRLDEIPQFVNILRGDMNLVGPRPHRVPKFELFVEQIPYFWLRFTIRPGLTGWAQTRYAYAQTLEEETEKVRYDLYYLKHMSFWLDVRILVDTIKIVLLSRGSAGAPRRETVVVTNEHAETRLSAA